MTLSSSERLIQRLETEGGPELLKAIRASIIVDGNKMELPGVYEAYRGDSPELVGVRGIERRATNWVISPVDNPDHQIPVRGNNPADGQHKALDFIARTAFVQGYSPSVSS